jgi:hypothetical protein
MLNQRSDHEPDELAALDAEGQQDAPAIFVEQFVAQHDNGD